MLLTLLAPLIGLFGSILPSIFKYLDRKQEMKYELDKIQLQIDAATKQSELQINLENVKADIAEGESVRSHDAGLDGGSFVNALRASIRPVITYLFFLLFIAVKIAAAYVMIKNGVSIPEMIKAVWDAETMALFATIMTFWFGSRTLERREKQFMPPTVVIKQSPKK